MRMLLKACWKLISTEQMKWENLSVINFNLGKRCHSLTPSREAALWRLTPSGKREPAKSRIKLCILKAAKVIFQKYLLFLRAETSRFVICLHFFLEVNHWYLQRLMESWRKIWSLHFCDNYKQIFHLQKMFYLTVQWSLMEWPLSVKSELPKWHLKNLPSNCCTMSCR